MAWLLSITPRTWLFVGAVFIALQTLALYLFGQPTVCECGVVRLWAGEVLSAENSQQFFDWYTFSHVIHGFVFFWFLRYLFPQLSIYAVLAGALLLETSWEVIENTPWLIEVYRQQALAQGYTGDSIINSVMDTLAMVVGVFIAMRLPWWFVVTIAVGLELYVGFMIHDSLTLNVLNFFYQFEFIQNWQVGG